ncbi:ISAs1 family transposase [Streptomyces sp. NBC_01264]|nr:ISAs1 family transposase [Streptomyces sp. NBC_01264]MCX4784210.1 ISAs1 family transposase [Streptomyces sp. NBC_01264]
MNSLLTSCDVIPDPRDPRGRRYGLPTLLTIMICAMTGAGHDSLTAVHEWCQRTALNAPHVLDLLKLPRDPFTGTLCVPDERTFRDLAAKLDAAALTTAGFGFLRPLLKAAGPADHTPDGVREREQHRVHRAGLAEPARRQAYALDGKYLRGARRADGTQVIVLSVVRQGDGVTVAMREIAAKSSEIPEFTPLLRQIPAGQLRNAVITADALHAQRSHATDVVEQLGAHYLLTVKNNQRKLADQLRTLPWKDVPVLHSQTGRGHGREEVRRIKVVTVDGLLFPHAKQVLRIERRRRRIGAKKWSTETVYAVTDLPAEQASPKELATWAREHWTVENTVHWSRDCTFNEDKCQVRTGNAPAVLAAIRDLVRGALHTAGYANIATGRRGHTNPEQVLTLYRIT